MSNRTKNEKEPAALVFSSGDKYDRSTGKWSRLLADGFVDFMRIQDGHSVLDVGCGTGILSLAVAERTRAAKIAGIDLSKSFIDYACGKSSDPRLSFEQGDAQNLPYRDGEFDCCLAMLVLQHVENRSEAVAQMKRVTRSGGAIGTALWDIAGGMSPNQPLWDAAAALGLPADIPSARQSTSGSPAGSTQLLCEAGLERIAVTDIVLERRFSSFDEYWLPLAEGEGVFGKFLGSLTPEQRAAVEERVQRMLLGDRSDGSFSIKARARAARAFVP